LRSGDKTDYFPMNRARRRDFWNYVLTHDFHMVWAFSCPNRKQKAENC
jgi:hypothetical protein